MEYQASAKYIHMTPRKVRLIADGIRGMQAQAAVAALTILPKRAAKPILDLLTSAIANAKAKQAAVEALKISHIDVMGGPARKLWRAVSRGTAHAYKKRMSHIKIVLTDTTKKEPKQVSEGGK